MNTLMKWLCTHRKQIITGCLLLLLVAIVGHLLVDATSFRDHSAMTLDLHGHFLLTFAFELATPRAVPFVYLLPAALFSHNAAPPTLPPPIPALA